MVGGFTVLCRRIDFVIVPAWSESSPFRALGHSSTTIIRHTGVRLTPPHSFGERQISMFDCEIAQPVQLDALRWLNAIRIGRGNGTIHSAIQLGRKLTVSRPGIVEFDERGSAVVGPGLNRYPVSLSAGAVDFTSPFVLGDSASFRCDDRGMRAFR